MSRPTIAPTPPLDTPGAFIYNINRYWRSRVSAAGSHPRHSRFSALPRPLGTREAPSTLKPGRAGIQFAVCAYRQGWF